MLSTGQQSLTPSPLSLQRLHATITLDQFTSCQRDLWLHGTIEGNYPYTVLLESLVSNHVPLLCPDSHLPRHLSSSSCMNRDPVPVSLLLVGIQGLFAHACWTLCLHQCDQQFGLWNNTQAREEDSGPPDQELLPNTLDFGHGDKARCRGNGCAGGEIKATSHVATPDEWK